MDRAQALAAMERLLAREREAVRRMDAAAIDAIAEQAPPLSEALRDVADSGALRRLREIAARNRDLLAHAVRCLRAALIAAAAATPAAAYDRRGAAAATPATLRQRYG